MTNEMKESKKLNFFLHRLRTKAGRTYRAGSANGQHQPVDHGKPICMTKGTIAENWFQILPACIGTETPDGVNVTFVANQIEFLTQKMTKFFIEKSDFVHFARISVWSFGCFRLLRLKPQVADLLLACSLLIGCFSLFSLPTFCHFLRFAFNCDYFCCEHQILKLLSAASSWIIVDFCTAA